MRPAREAGLADERSRANTTSSNSTGLCLRGFFRQRDGWLRQPPAARILALLVSAAPFLL